MSRPRLEEALDACMGDVMAGRRSVEQCLEDWPQLRDQLEPLLEAALELRSGPVVAERPPDPARRAQFMAALRETPQQRPLRRPLRAIERLLAGPGRLLPAVGRVGAVAAPAAAVAALALALVLTGGATTVHAATLTVFEGEIEQQVGGEWLPLADGALLAEGTHLRSGETGSAVLTFFDGSTASLAPNTELLLELASTDGARRIRLQQFAGRLWNDVAPDDRAGALYAVQTPDAVVTAHGTLFETVVTDEDTEVHTVDGLVELRAGEDRVFVAPGERARAQAQRLLTHSAAVAQAASEGMRLDVDGPFTASLRAPNGKAVGVLPAGIDFHQIAGATTSNPGDGPQRIELPTLESGTYRLLLRRIAAGAGELVLTVGADEQRFPLDRLGEALMVELVVTVEDGRLVVRPVDAHPVAVSPAQHERVVITDARRRIATSIADQRARRAAESDGPAVPQPTRPPAAPQPRGDERPAPTNLLPPTPNVDGDTPTAALLLATCRRLAEAGTLRDYPTLVERCRELLDAAADEAREADAPLPEAGVTFAAPEQTGDTGNSRERCDELTDAASALEREYCRRLDASQDGEDAPRLTLD